jgi:hypothetical protein
MRRRGKNEIEGWASLFSLSLSQSFFKLGPMNFSFLNVGALFYKFFFFQYSRGLKRRLTSFQGWAGHASNNHDFAQKIKRKWTKETAKIHE